MSRNVQCSQEQSDEHRFAVQLVHEALNLLATARGRISWLPQSESHSSGGVRRGSG